MAAKERGISRPGEPVRMRAAGLVCGEQAGPDACTRPVFARGLCRKHYRRLARGRALTSPEDGRLGQPSGKGQYGIVETDADGRLMCHECGTWHRALAVHIGMKHDGVRSYRTAHGLPSSVLLVARDLHETKAAQPDNAERTARILATSTRADALRSVDQEVAAARRRVARDITSQQ